MRFSIRDLLWLTLLAAVLVAWWVDRGAQADRLRPRILIQEMVREAERNNWGGVLGPRSQAP